MNRRNEPGAARATVACHVRSITARASKGTERRCQSGTPSAGSPREASAIPEKPIQEIEDRNPVEDKHATLEKFLIGRDGTVLKRYPPPTKPQDSGIMQDIADAL